MNRPSRESQKETFVSVIPLVKILWHDGVGMSLYAKRLEAGKFIWPVSRSGEAVQISAAQLGYLLEGIDWRNPRWTQRPAKAG